MGKLIEFAAPRHPTKTGILTHKELPGEILREFFQSRHLFTLLYAFTNRTQRKVQLKIPIPIFNL